MIKKNTTKIIKTLNKIYSSIELNLGIKKVISEIVPKRITDQIYSFLTNDHDLNTHHYTFRPRIESSYNPKKNLSQFRKLFDLEINKIKKGLKKDKSEYVGLELPEGMKKFVSELSIYLEKELGKKIVVSSEPCFGACDIKSQQFESVGIKTIIHMGNEIIPNVELPNGIKVIFIPLYINIPVEETVHKSIKYFKKNNISNVGVVSSISFIKNVSKIKKLLKANGIGAHTASGNKRLVQPAHVLGCNASSALPIKNRVDIFAMYENGSFHAPAVSLTAKTDVVCFDPLTGDTLLYSYEELKQKALKERAENLQKLSEAKKVGLLISSKVGQNRSKIIYRLEKMYSEKGYKTVILISDYIDPKSLDTTDLDILIASMCPRVSMDERRLFSKPILTVPEAMEFIQTNSVNKNDFQFDQYS